jgi:tungstate transport system substrate-binding protein
MKKVLSMLLIFALLFSMGCNKQEEQEANNDTPKDIILATTTSTQDSGLLDVLLPAFEEEYGYLVKTIAVGTGQALAMGEKGDADVLLTHAPDSELKLLKAGDIVNYRLVMHNDFVIVGPAADPAGIKGLATSAEAFKKIADSQALFVSRGDDSGTHKKELAIWKKAGIEVGGNWYQETGSGMGQTINVASEKDSYTLTDRATYLALKQNLRLEILVEGEPDLLNIYHVAQVNPEKSTLINAQGAEDFVEFMVSQKAQQIIGEFGVDKFGSPLFFPAADKDPKEYGLKY